MPAYLNLKAYSLFNVTKILFLIWYILSCAHLYIYKYIYSHRKLDFSRPKFYTVPLRQSMKVQGEAAACCCLGLLLWSIYASSNSIANIMFVAISFIKNNFMCKNDGISFNFSIYNLVFIFFFFRWHCLYIYI